MGRIRDAHEHENEVVTQEAIHDTETSDHKNKAVAQETTAQQAKAGKGEGSQGMVLTDYKVLANE